MNIGTRFAIGGAITSAVIALSVGAVLVRQSTIELENNAQVDLVTRLAAVAPEIASTPTQERLVDSLSANSTSDGIRVIRNGTESRVGDMPLRPPALIPNKVTTIKNGDKSWLASSTLVNVSPSISATPVEVDMFYPKTQLNHRIDVIRRRVRLTLLISVGAAVVLSWLVGTYVSRPLRKLSGAIATRRTAPNERVPENQGVQEVDELGRTINGLVDELQGEHEQTVAALDSARSFAFNAAHELRTPLTSIRTDLEVLRSHPELVESERNHLIDNVVSQHSRLNATLGALHDLSRGEFQTRADMADVDLAEIAEQVVDGARAHNAGANIELNTPDHVVIKGWSEGIHIAVNNLVTNALRHGLAQDGSSNVVVSVTNIADWVELSVTDTGPGIAKDQQESVFERFTRGSTAAPGTGLGLALVKQQAQLHGGDIHIEDVEPTGARFVWRFPNPYSADPPQFR